MKIFTGVLLSYCFVVLHAQTRDRTWILGEAAREIQMKQFGSAREVLADGAKRYPASAEIWNLFGIVNAELGRTKEAEDDFQHGLRLAPDSTSLNENFGLLFYKQSDFVRARKYLQSAVRLGSKQPGVLFSLAASQLRTGDGEEALMNLKTLQPDFENVAGYWEERGRAELLTNGEQAEADFQHALELEPSSIIALNGAASAAERQNLDEKALSYLVRARTADPNKLETLVHFGAVCIRRDLGPDAIEALQKARQIDPQSTAVLFLLARAHICVQNWQQAYSLFEEYSKRVPKDASAFYALGWVAIQLGRTEDAQHQLEHCLVIKPDLTDARYELAQLDLSLGQFETSEKLLTTVLKQNPNHAKAQMAIGEILLRRGDLDGAQAHLEKSIQQDAHLASAHYKLSTVLMRKHDVARAESERTLAVALEAEAKQASKTQLKLVLPEADAIH